MTQVAHPSTLLLTQVPDVYLLVHTKPNPEKQEIDDEMDHTPT